MAFNKLLIDGGLGGGVERWTVGVHYQGTVDDAVTDEAALATWAETVRALFASNGTWAPSLKALLGSNGSITRVRTYAYATPGTPAIAAGVSSGAAVPGTNSLTMPPQCSLVVSLMTSVPGRRTRGRFYWPNLTSTISADLRRSGNPTTATLATAFGLAIEDWGLAATDATLVPVVVSAAGGGRVTTVTSLSVGDVIDTQRRRRDALVENRTVVPVGV